MRLLLDANLSPRLVPQLADAGYDVVHVADLGLIAADDSTIFERAAKDGYVVVTADSDLSMLLALRGATAPSLRSPPSGVERATTPPTGTARRAVDMSSSPMIA